MRFLLAWIVTAAAVAVAVWLTPGTEIDASGAAFLVAAVVGALNAVLPAMLAALRLLVGHAVGEATGRTPKKRAKSDVSGCDVVVLGSGNLGLVYLMDSPQRLTREEIDERHPRLIPALRAHPVSAGCWCAPRSTAPSCSGPPGSTSSTRSTYRARTRWQGSPPPRRRT